MMIDLVCDKCGCTDLLFEANGVWVKEKQKYRFSVCEGAYCTNCDDLVPVKEIEIELTNLDNSK